MKHRDICLYVTPEEVKLLHALLLNHVYPGVLKVDLEPWEAKLLARIGRICNTCAIIYPGGDRGHDHKEAAPPGR